ncbi:hypothetical protein KEM48_006931 [Puccinia striiformis f. sp. tritici PST-130]|nr:hypothetical protein KEM48_006931 [Puccinia striiformis f. sp. tritici PST-130]
MSLGQAAHLSPIRAIRAKALPLHPSKLPGSINPFITHYVVRNVGPKAMGRLHPSRLKQKSNTTISDHDDIQKAHGGNPVYAHISKKVAEKWIGDCSAKQAELSKTQEPAMIWIEILQRKDKFMSDCNLIFNKPPPKLTANPDATMLWVTGSGTLCH